MGAWGAAIMSFFGAVFVALTMDWQWHVTGVALALPFVGFALIGAAAMYVIRLRGDGIVPSARVERVIMASTVAEGIGLPVASTIVVNLHRLEWRLPAMALVVGLHFLPIAVAAAFRPFYALGAALIVSAIIGVAAGPPIGGAVAGIMAGVSLWVAAVLALARDWRAKKSSRPAA